MKFKKTQWLKFISGFYIILRSEANLEVIHFLIKKFYLGISLVVQWLGLHAPNAGNPGSIPAQGTWSYMPQLEIPCAATKTRHGQINK